MQAERGGRLCHGRRMRRRGRICGGPGSRDAQRGRVRGRQPRGHRPHAAPHLVHPQQGGEGGRPDVPRGSRGARERGNGQRHHHGGPEPAHAGEARVGEDHRPQASHAHGDTGPSTPPPLDRLPRLCSDRCYHIDIHMPRMSTVALTLGRLHQPCHLLSRGSPLLDHSGRWLVSWQTWR